ncbi:MAG: hypothetical protein FD174_1680 [Geobacteraceae bacterium]|nr:MAG: hypothetical protein FD174_1680 [Geobacteraceae bacterium]
MNIMPMGDYYVWYCDWCDSKNLTIWTRFEKGEASCGACHNRMKTDGIDATELENFVPGGF